jgi:4-hydroxybenzoate polyprenyltransferase
LGIIGVNHNLSLQKIIIILSELIEVFLIYFLITSGLFILNDLFNLNSIRTNRKKINPLGVGIFNISNALILSLILIATGLICALLSAPPQFNLILIVFILFSISYIVIFNKISFLRYIFLIIMGGLIIFSNYILLALQ